MRAHNILELVDDEQREAVIAPAGPVLVVAGAGSGKTRTLTSRIGYRVATGDIAATQVLAVTHSTKAAGEMSDRLRAFSIDGLERAAVRTIHAAALAQLRYFWPATGRPGQLAVVSNRFDTTRRALRKAGVADPTVSVHDILLELEWAKSQLAGPDEYVALIAERGRPTPMPPDAVSRVYEAYEAELAHAQELDFSDILRLAADLMLTDEDVAAEIRRCYPVLCVDEYQDTDPLQQRLLDSWLGSGRDITAVGDPRQGIYGFKGADPSLMASFPTRYADASVVTLTRNYRSSPQILQVANTLSAVAAGTVPPRPRGRTDRMRWQAQFPLPLVATGPHGPSVRAVCAPDDSAESAWVAAQVSAAVSSGVAPRDIAVLYRYNSQSVALEQALTAAGVPCRVADGDRFFDRVEIRTVLEAFRARLVYERQRVEAAMAAASSVQDRADEYESRAVAVLEEQSELALCGLDMLREVLADEGWQEHHPPEGVGVARERWESRRALVAFVQALPGGQLMGAEALLAELETKRAQAHQITTQAVTLASLHRAKGLEWDVTFLPRWNEGTLPSSLAHSPAAVDEERRLAYVGLTRARRSVTISFSQRRADNGWTMRPSRFLQECGFEQVDSRTWVPAPSKPARGGARRPKTSAAPQCGQCRGPVPEALTSIGRCTTHLQGEDGRRWVALRGWRTETSRLDGVPPFRVLPDATLFELVAKAPTDLQELSSVTGIGPAKQARYGSELLHVLHPAR